MNSCLMRSLMFVPGHSERLLLSASKSQADVLLLDLEDSVQPESSKQVARDMIVQFVSQNIFSKYLIYPRINDRDSGHLLLDIAQLTIKGVNGFVYPKARTGKDIYFFCKLLETIEYQKKIPVGTYKIIPLIETAAAVLNLQDICQSSPRIIAIAYGCEDFITDLGGVHDIEGKSIFTPRALIAMAAKAHGIIPIDTVHTRVHDLLDLEKSLNLAKVLGFEGMLALNPSEIPLIHRFFTPSEDEIRAAKEMLMISDKSYKENKGVAIVDGKFIGPPMVAAANKLLARHSLIVKRSKEMFK
jgi:citrate lyase subunit beta/citryl-CoA lyase